MRMRLVRISGGESGLHRHGVRVVHVVHGVESGKRLPISVNVAKNRTPKLLRFCVFSKPRSRRKHYCRAVFLRRRHRRVASQSLTPPTISRGAPTGRNKGRDSSRSPRGVILSSTLTAGSPEIADQLKTEP